MSARIMLDLETLGPTAGSIILSIGAVKFDAAGITSEFYVRIDPATCQALGMTMDAATVLWWFKQADAARAEFTAGGLLDIRAALTAFAVWCGDRPAEMWGNGPAFDNNILSAAYQLAGLPAPWRHTADRCYRTCKALSPVPAPEHQGTRHNALDDARSQALHLIGILGA